MSEINNEQYERFDVAMHVIFKSLRKLQGDIYTMFPKGITSAELSVLKVIVKYPDAILKEIGEYLDIPGSTLTSVIDRLEERALIKRVVSKRNRRSYALELTDEGISISKQHEEAEKIVWKKFLASLSDEDEREILIKLLEKISKEME